MRLPEATFLRILCRSGCPVESVEHFFRVSHEQVQKLMEQFLAELGWVD